MINLRRQGTRIPSSRLWTQPTSPPPPTWKGPWQAKKEPWLPQKPLTAQIQLAPHATHYPTPPQKKKNCNMTGNSAVK